jgi:hypothetical protein
MVASSAVQRLYAAETNDEEGKERASRPVSESSLIYLLFLTLHLLYTATYIYSVKLRATATGQDAAPSSMVPVWYRSVRELRLVPLRLRFGSVTSFLRVYNLYLTRVVGVIAEVVASQTFTAKFKADATQTGLVVSMFTTGAFFGAAFAGPSGDYVGRRLTIVIGAVIFCLGGGLQTGAQNLAFLYAGRFFAGLGVGFLVMVSSTHHGALSANWNLTLPTIDCASVPSRALSPQYPRTCYCSSAIHVGGWRIGGFLGQLRNLC